MDNECRLCLMKSFEGFIQEKVNDDNIKCELSEKINKYINSINSEISAPEVARELHNMLAGTLHISDLHKSEKQKSNDIALRHYARYKDIVSKASNPFDIALRFSIAGNIMDFAACPEFFTNSEQYLDDTINEILTADFVIDYSEEMEERIKSSKKLLYLGDNAVEIVLDKLLIETIKHPNIYYAVRDKPVINDVTIDDAIYVGINALAKIISNGYDAPSTIIEKASKEFISIYNDADIVFISAGLGGGCGVLRYHNSVLFYGYRG